MIPDFTEFIGRIGEGILNWEPVQYVLNLPAVQHFLTLPPVEYVPYLVGAAVFCAAWSFWASYWSGRVAEQTRERVRSMLDIKKPDNGPVNRVRRAVNQLWLAEQLEKQLVKADISTPAADVLLALMVVAAVLAVLLSRAMVIPYWAALSLSAVIVAGVTGFVLRQRGANLADSVNKQLPEAARVLANGLRAGLSLYQAFGSTARELRAPLGPLIQRVVHEMQLGASIEEALDNLLKRVDTPDLRFMVTTILLQHEMGGDLAGALDSVASALVERMTVESEVLTLTAEQRYVAMVLPVIPVLGILIMNAGKPGYMEVLTRPLGLILLAVSGGLQVLGFVLIYRTSRIKV